MPDPDVRANTPATVVPGESPGGDLTMFGSNALAVGEEVFSRLLVAASGHVVASGVVNFVYFTARKTEAITQVRNYSGGTAAAATPTLCRMGFYSVAANGDLALIAACASDTTLWASTFTGYTRALTAAFAKVAGARYAFAHLVVTGAATPTFAGHGINTFYPDGTSAPRLIGSIAAQTDLPASVLAASVAVGGNRVYAVALP